MDVDKSVSTNNTTTTTTTKVETNDNNNNNNMKMEIEDSMKKETNNNTNSMKMEVEDSMKKETNNNNMEMEVEDPKKNSRAPPNRERANLSSDNIANVQAKRLLKQPDGSFVEIPRCPKRRYAVLVAYCGSGYQGLQINPGAKTIELELANAFFCSGGILDTNVHKLQRIGWSRSARTDKGVHAAMNLITAKLMVGLEEGDNEKFIQRCNVNLPEAMRVIELTIVTKSFNAQRHCAKRRYEYIMPTFMFRRDPIFSDKGWRYIPRRKRHSQITQSNNMNNGNNMDVDNIDETTITTTTTTTTTTSSNKRKSFSFYSGRQEGWKRHKLYIQKQRALQSANNNNNSNSNKSVDDNVDEVPPMENQLDHTKRQFRVNGWDTSFRIKIGRMEGWKRKEIFHKKQNELRKVGLTILNHGHGFWAQQESALEVAKYRLNEADRAKVNKMLSYYIGTHKYHNFTQGKRPDDMSCQRYMMSFTCSKPFLIHGIEFVQLHVVGQSFMIYQIRKMVGLIVHLMRRNVEKEEDMKNIFNSAFSAHQWGVSAVPADGLFLERLFFDGYNRKAERMSSGKSGDNKFNAVKRSGLTFDSPNVLQTIDDFKRQYIHRHIAQRIILYRPFTCWLNTQGYHYLPLPHDTQDEKVAINRNRKNNNNNKNNSSSNRNGHKNKKRFGNGGNGKFKKKFKKQRRT